MRKIIFVFVSFLITGVHVFAQEQWRANWITDIDCQNESNSWFCFRKDFTLNNLPKKAIAKIAIDSKYWLWINGTMVVFEGGLKRGPNANDTYYDEVDIAKFLVKGNNSISILGWFFGKDGFSHLSSGKFGLLFECITPELQLLSDDTWKVKKNGAYQTCPSPFPNFRLSESSIKYDASLDVGEWYAQGYSTKNWRTAKMLGMPPIGPWHTLIRRPIPLWKDFGLKNYEQSLVIPAQFDRDTVIVCKLPYNAQITPFLKVEAPSGKLIEIKTDNLYGGSDPNIYAQYITKNGVQAYESYGWMNGHQVHYKIPAGVKILELKYRETGYNTAFVGSFNSSDDFLNLMWQKALRTLYITMRDNYMDCPDRERAQWWGDEVNELGEAFYALDTSSHALAKKGMYELIGWQRKDSTLFSPVPAGNWDRELPVQMLTSIGYYGFWNYYLHTGDLQTIKDLYGGVRKYLKIWKVNENGTVVVRSGGWSWGDWGTNVDLDLVTNGFYYLALKGAANMAIALNLKNDAQEYQLLMNKIKTTFNTSYWNGTAYRHPSYKGKTDDRAQALAVVSGIAEPEKYGKLLEIFKLEEHASPYMEKYVLEALFQMNQTDFTLERMKKRFGKMINNSYYSTLFEGWGVGKEGFGGGTSNHAWSGGALTLLSQYLCGIEPLSPAYELFQIVPKVGTVPKAEAVVYSVKGIIRSSFETKGKQYFLKVSIPVATEAWVGIPDEKVGSIRLNSTVIWKNGILVKNTLVKAVKKSQGMVMFRIPEGNFVFESTNTK